MDSMARHHDGSEQSTELSKEGKSDGAVRCRNRSRRRRGRNVYRSVGAKSGMRLAPARSADWSAEFAAMEATVIAKLGPRPFHGPSSHVDLFDAPLRSPDVVQRLQIENRKRPSVDVSEDAIVRVRPTSIGTCHGASPKRGATNPCSLPSGVASAPLAVQCFLSSSTCQHASQYLGAAASTSTLGAEHERLESPSRRDDDSDPPLLESSTTTALRMHLNDDSASAEERALRCADGLQSVVSACCARPALTAGLLTDVGAAELSEAGLLLLAQHFAQANDSVQIGASFVRVAILPRLLQLSQPAPRALYNCIMTFVEQQPSMLVEELIMPLLWHASGHLNTPQSELLGRLAKALPGSALQLVIELFIRGEKDQPGVWSEAQVSVIQSVLTLKPQLSGHDLNRLLQQADANVDLLKKSLKFSNLIFTVIRSYAPQLGPCAELARAVTEQLQTFMKKTTLSAIDKALVA